MGESVENQMTEDSMSVLLAKLDQWSAEATADFTRTFGVAPGRWLQMETESGTLGACKRILTDQPEEWWVPMLTPSWEKNRLKWSVEALAWNPQFRRLFTNDERAVARMRLAKFGYPVDAE
jgi:hypothetical protein